MDFPLIWAAATEAASSGVTLSTVLNVIWCVFLVLIGVNMLIIVHEFGHFIVARMCGVRCDKFYIWFDIYGWKIFKFKWGDTEYGLGVLPLGGYVKMLGQEDSPGAIKAEIERAKLATAGAGDEGSGTGDSDASPSSPTPVPSPEQIAQMEQSLYAKDSYLAKSVPQRMAIIVAGVVMNVIFAFFCGVGAYMFGVKEMPSVIGGTVPGTSAWEAGLLPGDNIIAIDGKPIRYFGDINTAILGSHAETLQVEVQRPGEEKPIAVSLTPVMQKRALSATVGIINSNSLKLPEKNFYSPFAPKNGEVNQLRGQETLVALNGEKISTIEQLHQLEARWSDKPLTYTFEQKEKSGESKTVDVTLSPVPMRVLPFKFAIGAITALREQGKQAGFEVGDVLQSVNGEMPDPLYLPYWINAKIAAGTTSFDVKLLRDGKEVTLTVPAVPHEQETMFYSEELNANVSLPAFGIAYTVPSEVAAYVGDTPERTEAFGKQQDRWIKSVTFLGDIPEILKKEKIGKETDTGLVIENEEGLAAFPFLIQMLAQYYPAGTEINLTLDYPPVPKGQIVARSLAVHQFHPSPLTITDSKEWFNDSRGLRFLPLQVEKKANNFGEAVRLGATETKKWLLMVYDFIRNMTVGQATGTSRISAKGMGGPISIVTIAYKFASNGMGPFLILLCMLGANLAVLNILPIPVLDGGHVVFLTYEAIFRKPPNETVQVILSYMGLLLLLALMVWVFALDLGFIKRF